MKKILLISLVAVFVFYSKLFATHNMGGIITYRHISGTTYEATVTTYTKSSSPADRPDLLLYWGDDFSDTIPRISSELVSNNVLKNIYIGTHTYSSTGHYILHVEDPNRNAGIINIPNSVNVPFYIEAELITDGLNSENNSALFSGIPIFDLNTDSFSFNLGFYDPDADILTYDLIAPIGTDGSDVSGYSLPGEVSVDHVTGQLDWNVPSQIGDYVFAVKITECRNGEVVGSVVFDMKYTVINQPGNEFQFQNLSTWNMNNNGNYSYILLPNESFQLQVTLANASSLSAFGEPFISSNIATFNTVSSATDKLFSWQPTVARCSPYSVVFRGKSDMERDITVLIYVRSQNMEYCDTICGAALSVESVPGNNHVVVFPNPAAAQLIIQSPVKITSVHIFDITGREINPVTLSFADGQTILDISHLQHGNYVLVINGNIARRVVVE